MSWETVYKEKLDKVCSIALDSIEQLNKTSDSTTQAAIAIETIQTILREVAVD